MDASRSTICADCWKELAWKIRREAATTLRCTRNGESRKTGSGQWEAGSGRETEACRKGDIDRAGESESEGGGAGDSRADQRRRARLDLARNSRVSRESKNDRQISWPRVPRSRDHWSRSRSARKENGHRHRERIRAGVRYDPGQGEDTRRAEISGSHLSRNISGYR